MNILMKRSLIAAALAAAPFVLADAATAQGLVRGAERGAADGNRAAGPVGGIVGGAVGGAVGTVNGALGIDPDRRYRHRRRVRHHHR